MTRFALELAPGLEPIGLQRTGGKRSGDRAARLAVVLAVAEAAVEEALAGVDLFDIVQQVQDAMWQPQYRPVQAC